MIKAPFHNKPLKGGLRCHLCPSSDAVTRYETKSGNIFEKCFSCNGVHWVKREGLTPDDDEGAHLEKHTQNNYMVTTNLHTINSVTRGIAPETFEFYDVRLDENNNYVFPFSDYGGNRLAQKIRFPNKAFTIEHLETAGFQRSGLFGSSRFTQGGRYITVTEGEFDALATFEMQGSKYPVVSIKNGVQSKLTDEDFKYLNKFDNIIIAFDSDEPGVKAAKAFAANFAKNKAKIVTLVHAKDPNEYLERGLVSEFIDEWWKAKAYTPEGLVQGNETYQLLAEDKDRFSVPYPWQGLQGLLHGIRTSELIVLTAGSGVGKSEVLKELAYHIFKAVPSEKIGCLFIEESLRKTVKIFTGMEMGLNLRLPENVVDEEKRKDAWKNLFDNDRWIFWDHFGSNDIDSVCSQVRFIANNFGAKYIFLDHISIVVSDGAAGDERKALDQIMTKLRTLVQECDICLFLVSHLKRSNDGQSHEEGGVTSLSQLRGSAGIGQLADIVIGLERNGQSENVVERNITTIRILKNRFTGETGPACYVTWAKETGRLSEIESWSEVQKLIAEEEHKQKMKAQGEVNDEI